MAHRYGYRFHPGRAAFSCALVTADGEVAASGRWNGDVAPVAALIGQGIARELAAVSKSTTHRRLEDDTFCRKQASARSDLIARAIGVLARMSEGGARRDAQGSEPASHA